MVQMALANLMKDRTTFVIAHRLSTSSEPTGSSSWLEVVWSKWARHDNLLARGGTYQRLYQMQFQDHEDNDVNR